MSKEKEPNYKVKGAKREIKKDKSKSVKKEKSGGIFGLT
jgi:hypothetical protein